jgi:uncharacterized protein (TIGR00290 family)
MAPMDRPLPWRQATAADVPPLVPLVRSAYRGPEARLGWTSDVGLVEGDRIDEEEMRALVLAPAGAVLVVEEDGEIVACCFVEDRGHGCAHLGTFAVAPGRQAGGIGRRLLAEAERYLVRRFGARTLEITVIELLEPLIAWYERRGFERTGEVRPFPALAGRAEPVVENLKMITMRATLADNPYALSWSGGKDSALALRALTAEGGAPPAALLTTVTEGAERISMHGVRRSLLVTQARALGVPLVEVRIPPGASNDQYEERLAAALHAPPLDGLDEVAFGDLFLADIRAYRETRLAIAGKRATFPLWGRDTALLARQFLADGFAASLVCVDPRALDPTFAGRAFDACLLVDLDAAGVDPCGENGEFHTFVHAGPIFSEPIACRPGVVVTRDGFVFADLEPAAG